MNLLTYSLMPPEKYDSKEELFEHVIYSTKENQHLVPLTFSKKSLNPGNFSKLKKELKIKEVSILDRLKPGDNEACIVNHVNRSGYNFLVGKTPLGGLPRFPDTSNIYHLVPGFDGVVVHTVGPERFQLVNDSSVIISESVGLVSPLWHYVGVRVFALGIPS